LANAGIEPEAYYAAGATVSKKNPGWKRLFAEFVVGYTMRAEEQE